MASSSHSQAFSGPSRSKSRTKGARTSRRKSEKPEKVRSTRHKGKKASLPQEAVLLQPEVGGLAVPTSPSTGSDRGAFLSGLSPEAAVPSHSMVSKPTDSNKEPSTALQPSTPTARAQVSPSASTSLGRASPGRHKLSPRHTLAEEIQAIIELRELAEAGTLTHESPYRSKEQQSAVTRSSSLIATVAIVIATAVIGAIVVRTILSSYGEKPHSSDVCSSPECEMHRIIIGVDRHPPGQDPCDDFSRFVCGSWNNTQPLVADSVHAERITAWLYSLSMPGTYSDPKYTVLSRVADMAADCKDLTRGHDAEAVSSLVGFMTQEFFPWLVENSDANIGRLDDYFVPLRILLQLAIKWSLPLWFDVYLSTPTSDLKNTNRSISMRPCALGVMWKRIHDVVLSYTEGFYITYVSMFLQNVYDRNNVTSPLYRSFLANSWAMQGYVFGNLTHAYAIGYTATETVDENLPSFGGRFSADQWVDVLQSFYNFKPPITKRGVAFESNDVIITSINQLLRSYSARDVTFHTAWWLTQILALHTSKEIGHDINLDKKGSQLYTLSCGLLISESYRVLIASINLSGLTAAEEIAVLTLLNNVHNSALGGLYFVQRIDSRTRDSLSSMLAETRTIVWPDERHQSDESLLRLYGEEYNNTEGFFGHWRSSREQLQRSLGTLEYAAGETLYKLDSRGMAAYNPFSKVITVAKAALYPPFFYPQVPSSILYGGLGFLYAEQVVRSLHTMALHANKRQSLNRTVNFWDLIVCPEAVDPRTAFPYLPALEIAYAAYQQFRNDAEDLRLKGMEQYSPEQVFFLTACHGMCERGADGRQQSEQCNNMVRNFKPFSNAFSCPPGSPMNPGKKCRYL